jgi:beta-fructofuranosidase
MLHFKPAHGYFGDPMPFFRNGKVHMFYCLLSEPVNPRYHRIGHAVSEDLIHWEELPDSICPGRPCEPDDHLAATGSIVEKGGTFYCFYTGRRLTEYRERRETICLATSSDLMHWKKHLANPVCVPYSDKFEITNWRDPWVCWNDEEKRYWMLITALFRQGPRERRGCLALATSTDLLNWAVEPEPFCAWPWPLRPIS